MVVRDGGRHNWACARVQKQTEKAKKEGKGDEKVPIAREDDGGH